MNATPKGKRENHHVTLKRNGRFLCLQISAKMSQNWGRRLWGGVHVQKRGWEVCRHENHTYRGGAVG